MSTVIAPVLFTETRLNVQPTSSSSTFHISTESSSLFSSRKRLRNDVGPAVDDEEFFRRHLASETSIYFRSQEKVPRSILWRVLEEAKVLELQCVDLIQDQRATSESLLTFRLSFASPIRPNGVALADSRSHDALEVFVLTTSNELYTFSLRRDLLLRPAVPSTNDFDPSSVFKSYTLSSFSFRHPHKLVALNDLEILVSLGDGSLLHLQRRAGENGLAWREMYLAQGGIAKSLRGLIPWKAQNTVRHGSVDLSSTTATDLQVSPDGQHVFTVSLDHTLKSWTPKTGKTGFQIDLVGEEKTDGRAQQQYLIGPGQGTLLRVVEVENKPDGDSYYCVVWSPRHHQFKFWAIRDADSQEYGVRDVQSDIAFSPPLDDFMGTNVWQVADFDLKPGTAWRDTQLWVRVRSGSVVKMFTISFDLLASSDDLEYAWKHQWAAVAEDAATDSLLASLSDLRLLSDSSSDDDISISSTDDWLSYLLFPGRFPPHLLEIALSLYQRKSANGQPRAPAKDNGKSLQERLRDTIADKITGTQARSSDLAKYAEETAVQWRAFYQITKYLLQRQGESVTMALDRGTGLCWSIRNEQIAPIRSCSEIEVYQQNQSTFKEQEDEWLVNSMPLADSLPDDLSLSAARLFAAARSFRYNLSTYFNRSFSSMASTLALRDAEADFSPRSRRSDISPLQQLYDQCDLSGEVQQEDFERLTESVQDLGGLGELENNVFDYLLDRLSGQPKGQESEHALARYGDKATIRSAQEILVNGRETLLDVLSLVVFMSQDLETDELAKGFKPLSLYSTIAEKLREHDALLWMASNVRTEPVKARRSSDGDSLRQSQTAQQQPTMTVLESIFIGDWQSLPFPDEPLTSLLTYWCRAWTFGSNLIVNYDGVTAHVIGNLIKHEDYRLAYSFARFLPTNSWTTYLKARLYLGEGDYDYAAASFRRAAEDLSMTSSKKVTPVEAIDTANLISPTQRELFNAGLPRFFMHCCYLFEMVKLPSYAANFAELALAELYGQDDEALNSSFVEIDKRKRSLQDSPAAMQVDLAMEEIQLLKTSELKEDILSRLFTNALQTARYKTAFSALVKSTNPAIKRSSLTRLLTALLAASPSTLLDLPFPPTLDPEVDATLLSLARKSLTTASSSAAASSPSHIQLLYSYRISRDNYRGAAEGLYEFLQWLKSQDESEYDAAHRVSEGLRSKDEVNGYGYDDEESKWETEVSETYLLLINTLASCGSEAWILAEPGPQGQGQGRKVSTGFGASTVNGEGKGKRKVVTLEDVRREYQAELDRRSEISQGRFPLIGGEEGMEVDVF
ncbi:Nucleoporin Nup120/160-like protein [Elsinoe fawcettii]|nr:Nucleoporin Nup120/160-like protein [Elsinoe fawcettii]